MHTIGTFRSWLREEHYSPRTRQQYLAYVTRARNALGPLQRIDPAVLRAWWTTLPPSAASRNAARDALTAYYRHRGKTNLALSLPRIPEPDALPRPLSVEDYTRLFTAARHLGGRHEMLYFLLAYTGCRVSEARTARRSQFDLTAARWRIEGKGSRRRGPKQRVASLHPNLAAIVRTWPEPDWIFPSLLNDRPVHRTTVGRWWVDLTDLAGVDATPHRVRHTVATIGLEATRDIRAVQELLGHASLATTQRYTLVTGSRIRELVSHLGPSAV